MNIILICCQLSHLNPTHWSLLEAKLQYIHVCFFRPNYYSLMKMQLELTLAWSSPAMSVITQCRHMVPMQHNQWCVTGSAFCVCREESLPWHCCYAFASTLGVAIGSAVVVRNCNADLRFPSPAQSARSAQVCTIMRAEAEACVCA